MSKKEKKSFIKSNFSKFSVDKIESTKPVGSRRDNLGPTEAKCGFQGVNHEILSTYIHKSTAKNTRNANFLTKNEKNSKINGVDDQQTEVYTYTNESASSESSKLFESLNLLIKNETSEINNDKFDKNTHDRDIKRIISYFNEETQDLYLKNLVIYLTLYILDKLVMQNGSKKNQVIKPTDNGQNIIHKSSSFTSISASSKSSSSNKTLSHPSSSSHFNLNTTSKSSTASSLVPKQLTLSKSIPRPVSDANLLSVSFPVQATAPKKSILNSSIVSNYKAENIALEKPICALIIKSKLNSNLSTTPKDNVESKNSTSASATINSLQEFGSSFESYTAPAVKTPSTKIDSSYQFKCPSASSDKNQILSAESILQSPNTVEQSILSKTISPSKDISQLDSIQFHSTQNKEKISAQVKRDKPEDSSSDNSETDSELSFVQDRSKNPKLNKDSSKIKSSSSIVQNLSSNIEMNEIENVNSQLAIQTSQGDIQPLVIQPKILNKRQNFISNKNSTRINKDKKHSSETKTIREPVCIYFDNRFDKVIDSSPKLLKYVKDNTSARVRSVMRDRKKALIFPETNEDIEELMSIDL